MFWVGVKKDGESGDESEDDDDEDGLPPLERNMNHIKLEDSDEEDDNSEWKPLGKPIWFLEVFIFGLHFKAMLFSYQLSPNSSGV